MAKRITSVIVIISLSLSIFFGGLGLSLHFAQADDASSDNIVSLYDIKTYIENNVDVSVNSSWNTLWDFINSNWESHNTLITVASNGSDLNYDCIKICVMQTNSTGSYRWANDSSGNLITKGGSFNYFRTVGFIWYYGSNSWGVNYQPGNYTISRFNNNITFDSNQLIFAPTNANLQSSSVYTWCNHIVEASNNNVPLQSLNLQWDSLAPPITEYQLLPFWLGERRYITIKDQSLMRQLWGGDLMEYVLVIESDFDGEGNFDLISYQYKDLVLLQYSGVESQLSNISPSGVYAIDITSLSWLEIHDSVIYDFVDPSEPDFVGQCTNVPLVLEEAAPGPGTNGTPDSYSNSWNNFITYINNYDSTQVIPVNLVDTIFGVNGFKLYPVDVSLPSSTIPSGNPVTTNIHTYKYHFGSLPADIGLNYDLMDVCIIPKSLTGNYGLVFFYDDTLAAANKFVDYVDYKDILEQFDLILVIDDTLEALQENAWWEFIVPNDVWSHIDYMAVSGSSSLGIQYTSDMLPGNIESGFCIVTKRAIQRQQLYLFNDGITKSYKLMSDFVEKHGLWENSFFQWSQSIFYELQTIGGRTNDIYNLLVGLNLGDVLDNISRQLERIADNTSEEDPGYWFLSLWNFVSRFSVSDLDFANWVEDYDDFESQIPLPNEDVTPIPIPTITSEVG